MEPKPLSLEEKKKKLQELMEQRKRERSQVSPESSPMLDGANYLDFTYDMFMNSMGAEPVEIDRFNLWVEGARRDGIYAFESARTTAQKTHVTIRRETGESPGTPKLCAQARHYEVQERYGAVWIREAGSETDFPTFQVEGFHPACVVQHVANVPLELVLDNFTEVEHTSTTHAILGYDLVHMPEVVTRVTSTTDTVSVFNRGPQKKVPLYVQWLMGVQTGDLFVDEWTTYFSPVYSVYDQSWSDPKTDRERRDRNRIYVFFNPIGPEETGIVTFAFVKSSLWGAAAIRTLVGPVLRTLVNLEVGLDVAMLEQLANKSPEDTGMKLSRFDKVIGLNRNRIASVYRGERVAETVD